MWVKRGLEAVSDKFRVKEFVFMSDGLNELRRVCIGMIEGIKTPNDSSDTVW
jgi:hypothetical protein